MATRTRTTGRKKMARKKAKGTSAKRVTARRKSAPKAAARPARKTQVARVKRVAREVAHQAAVAVTAGVETLKDIGENLMDRVRA
jgi:hypothetical protein